MRYIFLKTINSTQDYLKEQLKIGNDNIVVRVENQVGGRGRVGRKWSSPIGGLWFSFDVEFMSDIIPLAVGVAVKNACEKVFNCKLLLKWPNDLILNGKKIAGILCEKVGDRVIVGVGVNTNIMKIEVENSISFFETTGKVIDNEKLMKNIIEEFFDLGNDKGKIINEFRKNMAFVGEEKYISAINKNAKIMGISDEGHLIVNDDGDNKEVFIGEILI